MGWKSGVRLGRAASIAGVGIVGATALGFVGPYAVVPGAALWWLSTRWMDRISGAWVFGVALALHLGLALSGFQSNDLHRYLWEGTVQLEGASPYATPPADPSLARLRDARFERIAYPELPSLYPPLAQASFVGAAALGLDERGYRNVIIVLSLALSALILAWLHSTGRPLGWAAFYAWSPAALLGAVGGHVDVLMAATLVGFVWAWESKRFRLAGLLLGAGILAKTVAVLLLPWAVWRRPRAVLATTLPLVALGYAPFLRAGNVTGSLSAFAQDFRFNAMGHELLGFLFGAGATLAAGGLLIGWIGWCSLRVERPADLTVRILGGLLLLSPVVHYWYLTWLLAVVAGAQSVRLRILVLGWAASIAFTVPLYLAIADGSALPDALPLLLLEAALPLVALAMREHRVRSERSSSSPSPSTNRGVSCAMASASSPSFRH